MMLKRNKHIGQDFVMFMHETTVVRYYKVVPVLWPRIALAILVILFAACFAQAGPREAVFVAEAIVYANQNARPELPPDTFQSAGQTADSLRSELAEAQAKIQSQAWTIAELKVGRAGEPTLGRAVPLTPMRIEFSQPFKQGRQFETTTITAEWCAPCQRQKRDNSDGNNSIWHRYVDEKSINDPELLAAYKAANALPLTCWHDSTGTLRYVVGYHSTQQIYDAVQRNSPATTAIQASGPAGTIHASAQIRTALDWFKANIGEGVKTSLRWDRTGAATFPLLAKGDWSTEALFGRYGRMELSAVGAKSLPIDAIGFGYKVVGEDVVLDLDPVTLKGLALKLGPRAEVSGASPAGFVDPMTIMTVVSVFRSIWSLLHPTADLQMGGNISATAVLSGDALTVEFQQCPSVKIVALFTFQLGVKSVVITEQKVHVEFTGSRWIKSREFSVQ